MWPSISCDIKIEDFHESKFNILKKQKGIKFAPLCSICNTFLNNGKIMFSVVMWPWACCGSWNNEIENVQKACIVS